MVKSKKDQNRITAVIPVYTILLANNNFSGPEKLKWVAGSFVLFFLHGRQISHCLIHRAKKNVDKIVAKYFSISEIYF